MEYVLLKNVHEQSQEWTVKVRVTRVTIHLDPQDPTKTMRLNFVLLDEESSTMEAEIQEEWVPEFAPKIHDGAIYYICYFRVTQARNAYCAVDRHIMARFTRYTQIVEVTPSPSHFPTYACSIVPFQTLRDRDNDNTVCSDILGVFTGCTHVKVQGTKGGPKKLRNVYLSDGLESVSIALWGSHAEDFTADEYMLLANVRPLVFLFVGLTSRVFRSSISLQGSLICKWFVNPDVPEAHALRERYIEFNGNTGHPISHGSTLHAPESERINVEALAAVTNPHTIYNKKYVIDVKIKCIKPNQQWWYHACAVCNRHATPKGDVYRCSFRRCTSTKGGPRYRIPLIAIDPASPLEDDNAPSIELVIFGPKAEEVLGTPVYNLIATKSGIGFFLPSKITELYGREFQMRISLSLSSLDRKDISFQVSSIFPVPMITAEKTKLTCMLSDRQCNAPSVVVANPPDVDQAKMDANVLPASPQHVTQIQSNDLGEKKELYVDKGQDQVEKEQYICTSQEIESHTPPPQKSSSQVEPKTYWQKRLRNEDDLDVSGAEENTPLAKLGRDKSRAAKRLKFEAPAKEI